MIFLAALILLGMPGAARADATPVRIFVSILPQAYFVERIGTDKVDVNVLVGPGQSPATYEPTPKQMANLGVSSVYFRIGTPFETGFIEKIWRNFKQLEIVDTREGVPLLYFRHHGEAEEPDPHIWLDPKRVKIQAATICRALCAIDPADSEHYSNNLRAFQEDLDRIDAEITTVLEPYRGQKIYVFHPAFGYFCDSYGLVQEAVEIEGKEPTPRQLSELISRARQEGVRIIFVQPQFSRKGAETIAREIGGAVVPLDPLSRDYLQNLKEMAALIRTSLNRQQE